ncbi:MAG: shikimate dehydrogenase [Bacteroidales bacterium]|nr:shikimate dehydrogenase [Bacteroidales bacterium]
MHKKKYKQGETDTYGLIGFPLTHSFSADFFNDKFQREGIAARYLNFEIEDIQEIQNILLHHPRLRGINVTIPHKESILQFLDEMTPVAKKIGAVNAIRVLRKQGRDDSFRLLGHNTDYVGFKESISPLLDPALHRKALVLGTGGASKAVVNALSDLGIEWKYVSRSPGVDRFVYDDLTPQVISEYRVIVNASPVGTYPHVDRCPDLLYEHLTPYHVLYDLVYNPERTLFLEKGEERGAAIKNGKEMLELQALAAWDFWK